MFEIKKSDLAGRIGILHSNYGKIETPAYVPVIHPVRQIIPAKKIESVINGTSRGDTVDWLTDIARKNDLGKFFPD